MQTDIKYGLPKVMKATFNEAPHRYELRQGFPDFPACPYGNTFAALGYDKKEKQYVWLVKSVIKDQRLEVKTFDSC